MATYTEQLQRVWREYEREHDHLPATSRDVVAWGVSKGHLSIPEIDPLDKLAEDMGRALREEYRTSPDGMRYRANHAVRISKGGVQYTFWADMDHAPRSHMENAFAQRRKQIVGDCLQLRVDADVYNSSNAAQLPIQMVLDFRDDVAEILAMQEPQRKAA
ncbi:MAG: hypothetical protein IOC94_08390 [Methylocystis sp.]|nr:hypothetical protein [Methylocystis sp.]